MFFGPLRTRPPETPRPAQTIHAAIVAAARRPAFYRDLGAPDTLPGRFELVVLHAALCLRRLRAEDEATAGALGQEIFDVMFRAFDDDLREIGVGDLSVPKRIKAMARSFYDGAATYDAALDAGDAGVLAGALDRIVFGGSATAADGPARLAAYVLRAGRALAAAPIDRLIRDGPSFPPVEDEA